MHTTIARSAPPHVPCNTFPKVFTNTNVCARARASVRADPTARYCFTFSIVRTLQSPLHKHRQQQWANTHTCASSAAAANASACDRNSMMMIALAAFAVSHHISTERVARSARRWSSFHVCEQSECSKEARSIHIVWWITAQFCFASIPRTVEKHTILQPK